MKAASPAERESHPPLSLKGKAHPVRSALARAIRPEPSRESAMGALRSPIIGRDAELTQLRGALERVAGGGSATVLVVAAPGTGKSRLVAEFLDHVTVPAWRARVRAGAGSGLGPAAR